MNQIMKALSQTKVQRTIAILVVACVALYPVAFSGSIYMHLILCTLGIYVIVNTGFDILFGYSGQISLGQAGFYAIGAYFSAILSKAGLPVVLSMLLAATIAAVVGYVLAIPCSKLVHHFLAIVTIGFGEIVRLLALNGPTKLTGGANGIGAIPPVSLFGIKLTTNAMYLYFVLALALLFLIIKRRIVDSRVGRAMQAIKCNPDASEAFGMKLSRYKAMAFTIAAFYAGVGGALYAHLVRFVSPESFSADQSSMFLVMILVGGMGTFCGPIIGSLLIIVVTEFLQQFGTYQMLIYGALIIFVLFFMPNGIAGTLRNKYYHLLNKLPARGKENGQGAG
ncbi:branched-chain amino acid ABC transporter permease [Agathobaculum sp. NTUH-O15-33]|uniref:branched-chain amino acid ABC transporter permease n=1 Tax=Agathobaculum sp. NTUH-O15-33 TaxID=3079302 RepID=UPI002958A2D8|nr:branched-chain amino acid ABC transporter permease [Agathobaculum sp. NTUH-O15-33]WNX83072.1 branched-chain amino acid ABC transporter permease [Agathobaculum sp. NTUH-O15-33]